MCLKEVHFQLGDCRGLKQALLIVESCGDAWHTNTHAHTRISRSSHFGWGSTRVKTWKIVMFMYVGEWVGVCQCLCSALCGRQNHRRHHHQHHIIYSHGVQWRDEMNYQPNHSPTLLIVPTKATFSVPSQPTQKDSSKLRLVLVSSVNKECYNSERRFGAFENQPHRSFIKFRY